MQNQIKYFLIFSSFILVHCSENTGLIENQNEDLSSPIIFYACPNDINSLDTDSVVIRDINIWQNNLIIDYSFFPAYKNQKINLVSHIGFMETSPPMLNLRLVYFNHDEGSKFVNKTQSFELNSIASLYEHSYRSKHGSVLMNIYASDTVYYHIRYDF